MSFRLSPKIKAYLVQQIDIWYSQEKFPVAVDPLGVVRSFHKAEDQRTVEAAAFFAALFAWGRRDIAIAKTKEILLYLIDKTESETDACLKAVFEDTGTFKHRTFTQPQVKILVLRLQDLFDSFGTLEAAFLHFSRSAGSGAKARHSRIEDALNGFRRWFFEPDWVSPVARHIASPERGSACKRLNLMLKWLVRPDELGLDLGTWKSFQPSELVMPLDVHVINSANHFGFMQRSSLNWLAAVELTEICRKIVLKDPVVLDYVLFGLSNAKALPDVKRLT